MPPRTMNAGEMPTDEMEPKPQSETTGKLLVLFDAGDPDRAKRTLKDRAGIASVDDSSEHGFYPNLGVAVLSADPDQQESIRSLAGSGSGTILTAESEETVGINPKIGTQAVGGSSTWGLQETKAIASSYTGKGIKVAILDTGFDFSHPDFANRFADQAKQSRSFIDGEAVQDEHGHGTHCTGTACGSRDSNDSGINYGVACEAEIYIGKVLDNHGDGSDRSILAGINWAIEQGCQVISMSLGGFVARNVPYSAIYEQVAQEALKKGILIIAAAGNDSHRDREPQIINAVNRPANSPSIMAVGAIDRDFEMGWFSNGGMNASDVDQSGAVDIAAPGVNIYSSWIVSQGKYTAISGTSMATPHVAGIAALYAEATGKRGRDLWNLLSANNQIKSLQLPTRDVGCGLIQAP